MGFNTVAFLLNDFMHDLKRSPKSATWLITNPPMSGNDQERSIFNSYRHGLQVEHQEPLVHDQALEVLPTFHADWHKFFMAGGNCINELQVLRFGKTKEGRTTVTLELPEWYDKARHGLVNLKR